MLFFQKIGLKEKIGLFDGVIIAVSAGSMNSAEIVYAGPELEGEAYLIKDVEQSEWNDEVWDRHIIPDEKYLYKKPGYSCDD